MISQLQEYKKDTKYTKDFTQKIFLKSQNTQKTKYTKDILQVLEFLPLTDPI